MRGGSNSIGPAGRRARGGGAARASARAAASDRPSPATARAARRRTFGARGPDRGAASAGRAARLRGRTRAIDRAAVPPRGRRARGCAPAGARRRRRGPADRCARRWRCACGVECAGACALGPASCARAKGVAHRDASRGLAPTKVGDARRGGELRAGRRVGGPRRYARGARARAPSPTRAARAARVARSATPSARRASIAARGQGAALPRRGVSTVDLRATRERNRVAARVAGRSRGVARRRGAAAGDRRADAAPALRSACARTATPVSSATAGAARGLGSALRSLRRGDRQAGATNPTHCGRIRRPRLAVARAFDLRTTPLRTQSTS